MREKERKGMMDGERQQVRLAAKSKEKLERTDSMFLRTTVPSKYSETFIGI